MAECTTGTVAGVVVAGLSRSGWRIDIGHMTETANADGTASVQVWTREDVAAMQAAGYAMTGEIIRPSYVITVSARDGES